MKKLFDYYMSVNQIVPAIKYGLKAEDYVSVLR
jgi:hypothetical protein